MHAVYKHDCCTLVVRVAPLTTQMKGNLFKMLLHYSHIFKCLRNEMDSWADPGGGGPGVRTPFLGHDVGFLTLGPKLDPS